MSDAYSLSTSQAHRSRAPYKRLDPVGEPTVTQEVIDEAPAVRVSLFGKGSDGKTMLLDADVWDRMSKDFGTQWVLGASGKSRHAYVVSGRHAPARRAKQSGEAPLAVLARLIAKAPRRSRVRYRNGDRLDLRRRNLRVIRHQTAETHAEATN